MSRESQDPEGPRRVSVRISGRVQGVGFRYSARRVAMSLGLSGWVRNLPDGNVEAVFQGPPDAVEDMIEWCRKGPSSSRVDRVDTSDEPPGKGEVSTFDIRF